MRSSLHVRIMLVVGPVLVVAAVILAFVLQQQTVSQFVVYLSSQEQLERFSPQDRVLLRYYADRIASVISFADEGGLDRIMDAMARAVDREIVVARNDNEFHASRALREMDLELAVTEMGILIADMEDASLGIQADLELSPVVTQAVTPFTVDDIRDQDVVRVFGIPPLTDPASDSEEQFVSRATRQIIGLTALAAAAMIVLIGAVVTRSLAPVRKLTAAANAMREGRYPDPVEVEGPREINDLAHSFNAMARTVRDTEASRRRFLADISHELRGPLSNLRSQIEAMQDGLLDPNAGTFESLHDDAMLLTRLVDDLHELTLADMHELRLDLQPASPSGLVASAVAPLRPSLVAAGIELEVEAPESLPDVEADAQRIVQVLRNVLQNAIRYSGGESITIRALRADGWVRFSVADTGVGVRDDDLDRIFNRFYRPDPSRARASGGSGLGLAIARAIVLTHDGRIRARPNVPRGLVVEIDLPARSG